jgi:hypothetical protein
MIRSIKVPEQNQDELDFSNDDIRQIAERAATKLPPVQQMVAVWLMQIQEKHDRKRNARDSD